MLDIKPFACIRPAKAMADKTAALPYDVYNKQEAKEYLHDKPYSFLRIDRAETAFEDDFDMYSDEVYKKAGELLEQDIKAGIYIKDEEEAYYIYELTMEGRSQSGIAGCASIDDYLENRIKRHENTRVDKELDRIRHIEALSAQTGAIFLAYRSSEPLKSIINEKKQELCLYDFISDDEVRHRVWKISDAKSISLIKDIFAGMKAAYIADGHHRAASAVKAGLARRKNLSQKAEESDYFLSVLFDEEDLSILPYNRAVKDLAGLSKAEFLNKLSLEFNIQRVEEAYQPVNKKTFGMYIDKTWYRLAAKQAEGLGLVEALDVSILEAKVLNPILGIKDLRTDSRIGFIGGIKGLKALENLVDSKEMAAAFSLYPTSIKELFAVADAGLLMPPKSTWFEPKLRSGIFIHKI